MVPRHPLGCRAGSDGKWTNLRPMRVIIDFDEIEIQSDEDGDIPGSVDMSLDMTTLDGWLDGGEVRVLDVPILIEDSPDSFPETLKWAG